MANVVFDDESAKRIAAAVKYVEGLQNPEDQPADETSEQTGRTVIRGTFSGEWAKGTDKAVAFTADNGDSKTKTATNYFADVGESGGSTDCVIMLAGGEWVLVSAEPTAPAANVCKEVVTGIASSGNLTLVSDVTASGVVVTDVSCVNGNLSVTTADLSSLITATSETSAVADLLSVTAENVTLPPQGDCE